MVASRIPPYYFINRLRVSYMPPSAVPKVYLTCLFLPLLNMALASANLMSETLIPGAGAGLTRVGAFQAIEPAESTHAIDRIKSFFMIKQCCG
jgi:hypothetical protein